MTSFQSYTATAGQTQFAIPFRYIQESFVKVDVNGTELTLNTGYTISGSSVDDGIFSGGNVELVQSSAEGDTVKVFRDSGITDAARLVDFEAGSRLKAADLDKSAIQLLHLIQEVKDNSATAEDMTITIEDVVGLQSALDGKAADSVFAEGADGIVPGPNSEQYSGSYFLRADGNWVAVSTSGGGGSGASFFHELADTPLEKTTTAGQPYDTFAGKMVVVNQAEDGLTYATAIQNLKDLSDVDYDGQATPNDGDAIVYNGTQNVWKRSPATKIDLSSTTTPYRSGNLLVSDGTNYEPFLAARPGGGAIVDGDVLKYDGTTSSLVWGASSGGGGLAQIPCIHARAGSTITVDDGGAIPFGTLELNTGTLSGGGSYWNKVAINTNLNLSGLGGLNHNQAIAGAGLQVNADGVCRISYSLNIHNTSATSMGAIVSAYVASSASATGAASAVLDRAFVQLDPGGTFQRRQQVNLDFTKELTAGNVVMITVTGTDINDGNVTGTQFGNLEINRAFVTAQYLG